MKYKRLLGNHFAHLNANKFEKLDEVYGFQEK